MTTTRVVRRIHAPVEQVFDAVAKIENFAEIVEAIESVEFLSEEKVGVGARFRETRRMGKRLASTELEVTEYVENDYVRIVSDAGGTIWDTVYRCTPDGSSTRLEIDMDARPQSLKSRLMLLLIMPMVRKGMTKHLKSLKEYCESTA